MVLGVILASTVFQNRENICQEKGRKVDHSRLGFDLREIISIISFMRQYCG